MIKDRSIWHAGLIFLLALTVRLYNIGEAALVGDEIFSWIVAHLSPGRIVGYLASGNNPPLWEILLHYWRRIGGDSEGALRGLAAVFSAGAASGLYLLGRSTGGSIAGWIAAACWTFSTFGQSVGREARAYALLAFLTVVAHLLFLRWSRTQKGFYLWIFSCAVLFYTHYMGAWVPLVQLGALPFLWPMKRPYLLPSIGLLGLGVGLQGIVFMDRLQHPAELGYAAYASVEGLYNMLWQFSNMPVPTVMGLALLPIGLLYAVKRKTACLPEKKYAQLSFWGIFLPMWVLGLFLHLWNPRYLLPAAMSYYWVLGLSVAELPHRLRLLAATALVGSWLLSWDSSPPGPYPLLNKLGPALSQRPPQHLLIVSPRYQTPILAYYPGDTFCLAQISHDEDPLSSLEDCFHRSKKILSASAYGEIPPCELQAADTLWWLDFHLCFSHPDNKLETLLWEEFTPVAAYEIGPKVTLWQAVRRVESPHVEHIPL